MKSSYKYLNVILMTLCISGCVNSKKPPSNETQIIELDYSNDEDISNSLTTTFFEERTMVKLETTEESVFSDISRLIIFENKYYIYDMRSQSVLIFNENGRFLFKIKPIGRGPGEYTQLSDFSIDTRNKQIVLLCAMPQKLMYFDLNGKFIKNEEMPDFNRSLSVERNSKYFVRYMTEEYNNHISIFKNNEYIEFLPIEDYIKEKIFYSFHPEIIKSDHTYFFKAYDNTIYELKEDSVIPKYSINFGSKSLSPNTIKHKSREEIERIVRERNLISRISDFRESNDYLTFCTYPFARIVIYNKSDKRAKLYSEFYDPETGLKLHHSDHIAHDGSGKEMVFDISPGSFKHDVLRFQKEKEPEKKAIYDQYLKMANNLKDTDNPILMIYSLR